MCIPVSWSKSNQVKPYAAAAWMLENTVTVLAHLPALPLGGRFLEDIVPEHDRPKHPPPTRPCRSFGRPLSGNV